MQAAGNMQHRNEATNAAREVIEGVMSNTRFFETPNSIFLSPCGNDPNTKCVDTNADNTPDVTVAVTPPPACLKAQAIKTAALDLSRAEDAGCSVGTQQNFGVGMPGSSSGDSLCAESMWEIRAEATDAVTETKVVAAQGVGVRISNDSSATFCP